MTHKRNSTKPRGSRTLIVEKNAHGHRLYYVRILAQSEVAAGNFVVVALDPSARESDEYFIHLKALEGQISIIEADDFSLGGIERLSRIQAAAVVVVPDGDALAMDVARAGIWLGSGELSLLVMREEAQPRVLPGLQSVGSMIRTRLFQRAASVSSVRLTVLKSALWSGKSAMLVANDPVTNRAEPDEVYRLAQEWGLLRGVYWFGVLGAISARKNVPLIVEALARAETQHGLGLLIAGDVDATLRIELPVWAGKLERAGVELRIVDRILTDIELDTAIAMIDCVVIAHSNEGPSGLLGKAALTGTRVLAAGARSLQRDVAVIPASASWTKLRWVPMARAMTACTLLPRPDPMDTLASSEFTNALL